MNIKDIFSKAENGTLTFEQFMELAGDAKFADLAEGNYVAKQKYTDDLAVRDTRITALDTSLKTRDADLANLQAQLNAAGEDKTKLDEVNAKFTDLQSKYDKDTKAYAKQLKEQAYKFAVSQFADKQEFSSGAAKRDFVNSMMAKQLQMEGDMLIGATDFMERYKTDNADAFKVATPEPEKPHFAGSTGGTPAPDNANAFNFGFVGVRPHKD